MRRMASRAIDQRVIGQEVTIVNGDSPYVDGNKHA